jgi:hypothetical protein
MREWHLLKLPELPCPDRTALNSATEYTETNKKDFPAFLGYLHGISLSKMHLGKAPLSQPCH